MGDNAQNIFGITGWKNSGKTQLVTSLVSELTERGFNVSTVKHAHHSFDIDHEGTDSYRHRKSGAGEVALVSRNRWALMHELKGEAEPPLEEVLAMLKPCDLVIIEGYKRECHPKIEVHRKGATKDEPLWPNDPSIVAVATDHQSLDNAPTLLDLNNIPAIADFILTSLEIKGSNG